MAGTKSSRVLIRRIVETGIGAVPVMRPKLPAAAALLPYLSRIDRSRIYSNLGPLVAEFETRLAAHFNLAYRTVTTVVNGTLGIVMALTAQESKAGTLCVMPAWTFITTAQAAVAAGLVPFFVDVEPDTWALDPGRVRDLLRKAPGEVGAVVAVMPFGRPIDFAAWDRFRAETGLPVVIDAAAGFDRLQPTDTPAVVSLHATKVFGIGEGGFVMSRDRNLIQKIRTRTNFGFDGTRQAIMPALNAKMSEYHAAVGLAALDEWADVRAEWLAAARVYRTRMTAGSTLGLQAGFGESWVSSVCLVEVDDGKGAEVEDRLRNAGIETRRWWSDGAHAHPSTAQFARTPLPVTDRLARSTVGLPFSRDLQVAEIDRILDICCV